MSDIVQGQPSVVLRSTYQHLRALLAIAIVAVVALTIAVVVLATSGGTGAVAASATRANSTATNGRATVIHSAAQPSSGATGSPQVGPNPDQRDLISSGGTFPPAGPNPDQATQ